MAGNASPTGYSVDGMGCAAVDEQLLEHEGHLKYRWEKFMETKGRIEEAEGSLEEFSKGYLKFGFNKTLRRDHVPRVGARRVLRVPHRRLQRVVPGLTLR